MLPIKNRLVEKIFGFFSSLPFLSGNTNVATVAIWQLVYRTNLDQKAVIAPEHSSLFCLQLKEIEDKILEVLSSSEVRVFFFFFFAFFRHSR